MKKFFLLMLLLVFTALFACGGGSQGDTTAGAGTSETGTVALFVTDNLDYFDEVFATITGVWIRHTGTGVSCSLLSDETSLDVTDLAAESLLLDLTNCPAGEYNRIRIETGRSVLLTHEGITDECTLVSYKDGDNNPNVLQCDGETCSLEINGAVNVLADNNAELTLDFDLKEFEVEHFGEPDCSVTIKVKPLDSEDIHDKKDDGMKESIKGTVSDLDTVAGTFILTRKEHVFTVLYGDVGQEGVNELLAMAQANSLMTKVVCSELSLESSECGASGLHVDVLGTVSELTDTTFTLTFNPDISVDFSGAEVSGTLVNEAIAEVRLSGFNGTSYIAYCVEVEGPDDEHRESLTGTVSDLDIAAGTFTLTREEHVFFVLYGNVEQPGIDDLLVLAHDNALSTKVVCPEFNPESMECLASEMHVKVGGIVSGLTDTTFTLTFNPAINVDFSAANVYGTLANGAEAEVYLFGFNSTDYLAYEVEIRGEPLD